MAARARLTGKTGHMVADSTPWWPAHKGEDGRSNIPAVLIDDCRFSRPGCYDSSTP